MVFAGDIDYYQEGLFGQIRFMPTSVKKLIIMGHLFIVYQIFVRQTFNMLFNLNSVNLEFFVFLIL